MRINAFSVLAGLSAHALRHYESLGLLCPRRLPNGYRDYAPEQVREAVFIAMSREVGIPLPVIAEQLPRYRAGRLKPAEIIQALLARRDELDAQIATLKAQRKKVVDHARWIEKKVAGARKTPQGQGAPGKSKPWPRASRPTQGSTSTTTTTRSHRNE
jgi:MerR family transcriptional regulator, copper efflux regulator